MLHCKAFMLTQARHHGARVIEAREVKSSATKAKIDGLLRSTKKDSNSGGTTPKKGSGSAKSAKAYGSHDGSTHVQAIIDVDITDNQDLVSAIIKNSLDALVSQKSFDIRDKKYQYKLAKNKLEAEFKAKHGTRLTEEQFAQLQNAKADLSFDYYATQIVVVMTDPDNQFEDSEWDEERQAFVLVIKSKTVYTVDLLVGVAKEIASIAKENGRPSRLKIEKSYDKVRIIAIFNEEKNGFHRLRMDVETRRILGLGE